MDNTLSKMLTKFTEYLLFSFLDFYDVIVSCGCFCPGHLPFDAVIEMIRITKPG